MGIAQLLLKKRSYQLILEDRLVAGERDKDTLRIARGLHLTEVEIQRLIVLTFECAIWDWLRV